MFIIINESRATISCCFAVSPTPLHAEELTVRRGSVGLGRSKSVRCSRVKFGLVSLDDDSDDDDEDGDKDSAKGKTKGEKEARSGMGPAFLALKHKSRILRHSSNPVCGFSMTEQVRLCAVWPAENWLGSSLNQIQGWTTV